MKVVLCNFATSKSIKTHIEMKKILSLILVMMAVTLPVIQGIAKSQSFIYFRMLCMQTAAYMSYLLSSQIRGT